MRITLCFLGLMWAFFSTSHAQSKQAQDLARRYVEVSNRPFGETAVPLVKWADRDTLRYLVVGKSRYFPQKNWQRHADEVGEITGLHFEPTTDASAYDLLVFLGSLEDFYTFIGKESPLGFNPAAASWISGNWDTSYRLTKSYLCMNDANIKDGMYAEFVVRRALLEMVGLRGRSTDKNSLMYQQYDGEVKNYRLTDDDKRLLAIHYDAGIRPGTTREALKDSLSHWVDLEAIAKRKL